MKHISGIALIAAISMLGELMAYVIPLPVPGSIYGLAILFILLLFKVVKLSWVKTVSDFLISLMPVMFVAPVVELLKNIDACRDMLIPVLIISTLSTVIVMAVTGVVSQAVIKSEGEHGDDK